MAVQHGTGYLAPHN